MTESGDLLPDEQRCKRSDGRKWRCRRPVMEGKALCEAHFLQGRHRQQKEPVPDNLKLERQNPTRGIRKIEENPTGNLEIRANGNVGCSNLPPKRGKRKVLDEENPIENLEIRANGNAGCSLKRGKRKLLDEENPSKNLEIRANGELGRLKLPRKRGKTNRKSKSKLKSSVDVSEDLDDALKKMNLKKGDLQLDLIRGYLNRQIEKKKGKQPQKEDIVKELKYGRLEISQSSSSSTPIMVNNGGLLNVKIGVPAPSPVPTRFFRSKNIERIPIATMQVLPNIKANVKAAAKKKCHWCRMGSYRVLVKCLTCKKQFFCEDCIRERYHEKTDVKKQCPVCHGTCGCRVCVRGRSKDVKTKDLVVYNDEGKFDKAQQLLYVIHLLLPLLEQINQEKIIELDIEAKIKGKTHSQLKIQYALDDSQKQHCSFCKACIVDVHRSCGNCSYVLCVPCCREFRDGLLHKGLRDFTYTKKPDKRKSLCSILSNWKTNVNGSIKCPPKNLGGCGAGFLNLLCHSPVNWTKDLEATAKEIDRNSKFTKFLETVSSNCPVCDKTEAGIADKDGEISIENKCLYFSTGKEKGSGDDENLEHFTKHWVKGEPVIIRDVLKSEFELSWDPVFMFCLYLERSAKSRKGKDVKSKNCLDWCEVEIGRRQIFMGGITHANVWSDILKFKVWLSSGFFKEQFPSHYEAVMRALPVNPYMNPLSGFLNLATKLPPENQNPDLGPFVYISYGRPEDLTNGDFLTKLCYHAYDMVNILVHATELPVSDKKLVEVITLLHKYSSQDRNEPSRNHNQNKPKNENDEPGGKSSFSSEITQQSELNDNANEELTQVIDGDPCLFSDDSSTGDSDDEDSCPYEVGSSSCNGGKINDTRGAQWDVFRKEDVSKLAEYLRKYSNVLNQSYGPPKKVVHPILDESFYLDNIHKQYLKEEFDVEPWTFEQRIGEAVIIPAGCPYQVKKNKSCVNVVLEFISPESASKCIELSDEIRQLPVNHKAKGKMLEVKKMTIRSVSAAIEEIRKVSQAESIDKVGE